MKKLSLSAENKLLRSAILDNEWRSREINCGGMGDHTVCHFCRHDPHLKDCLVVYIRKTEARS